MEVLRRKKNNNKETEKERDNKVNKILGSQSRTFLSLVSKAKKMLV